MTICLFCVSYILISTHFNLFQISDVFCQYYLILFELLSELLQDRPNGKMTPRGNKFRVASLFSPTMHRFVTPATPPVVQLTSRTKVNVRMVSQMRSSIKAKVPFTFRQLLCLVQNMKNTSQSHPGWCRATFKSAKVLIFFKTDRDF